MTEGIDGDAGRESLLKDRGTVALLCFVAAIIVIGSVYGYVTQDDRLPQYTMEDIPVMADGSYEYEMAVDVGFVTSVTDVTVEFSDGEVVSIVMNGSEMPAAEVEKFVKGLTDTNVVRAVDLGQQWTDEVDVVDTYAVECTEGSAVYAEDGTLMNLIYTGEGYTLSLTLSGWEPISAETTQ